MTGRRAAVLALLIAAGSVACRQILGLSGEGVVSSEGGVDASLDATGGAETGVDGGAEGNVAESSSPVACGQGLPTDAASFQGVVRGCMMAISCNLASFATSGGYYERVSDCISNDTVDTYAEYGCLKTITDCTGYTACTGVMLATASQCPTAASPASCSGAQAVNCSPGVNGSTGLAVACDQQLAKGCDTYSTDAGTVAACLVLDSCADPTDGRYHCAGNVLYTCVNGRGFGTNCSSFQSTCAIDPADPAGGANCYDNGTPCDPSNPVSCMNASTLRFCGAANIGYTTDCAAAGMMCVLHPDNTQYTQCIAPGCTFGQASTFTESCSDGSVANLFIGGAPYAFDCRTLGATFSACAVYADGSGTPHVYCR